MLVDDIDLVVGRNYEYYFKGRSQKLCQFVSDKELKNGSIVIINDVISTHIFKVLSIKEINGRKLIDFEDFEVSLCSRTFNDLNELE